MPKVRSHDLKRDAGSGRPMSRRTLRMLAGYVAGKLDARQQETVRRYLARSPEARQVAERLFNNLRERKGRRAGVKFLRGALLCLAVFVAGAAWHFSGDGGNRQLAALWARLRDSVSEPQISETPADRQQNAERDVPMERPAEKKKDDAEKAVAGEKLAEKQKDNAEKAVAREKLADKKSIAGEKATEITKENVEKDTAKEKSAFASEIQPLLKKYCFACHEGDDAKKGLRLDVTPDFKASETAASWKKVEKWITTQAMPPKKSPQPSSEEVRTISRWISSQLSAGRESEGRTVLRRLNREEYQNTLNDLFGINCSVWAKIPEDASFDGFDNIGAALRMSPIQMQSYLSAADAALDVFFKGKEKDPRGPSTKNRYLWKNQPSVKGALNRSVVANGEKIVIIRGQPFYAAPGSKLEEFRPKAVGNYRFRFPATAHQSKKPITFAVVGWGTEYFEAIPGEATVFELTRRLGPDSVLEIVPALGYRFGQNEPAKLSGLALEWVEVEGPLPEPWPPAGYQRIMGRTDLAKGTIRDAERILRTFLPLSFRRPVPSDELRGYLFLVRRHLLNKEGFEKSLREAFKAAICSPQFLFLTEKPGKLDDYMLASRLSYFLWSSMPDEELLKSAAKGELSKPDVRREQVERLLQSPKAKRFTANFLGQWLGLRRIDATAPDGMLYPHFNHLLKTSMVNETHLFFEEILKNDLSIRNFIDSDFAMLNRPLADLYDIPDVAGMELKKVKLPRKSHRGGLLTQASILKITANGSYTSPIPRGVWVLKNILGRNLPPPPPNVSALEPDTRGAVSLRQQVAKHRKDALCASCHNQIDPLGFALENYDVIGGWRDGYLAFQDSTPKPTGNKKFKEIQELTSGNYYQYRTVGRIDSAGVLPDGKRFKNIDDLKKLLLGQSDQVARCVAEKLLVYATGSPLDESDREVMDELLGRARDHDYGLRTLLHEVVQSKLFLNK